MSDIRVSVQWKSSAVFAGENIECTITFKNVAQVRRSPSPNSQLRGHGFPRERRKDNIPQPPLRRTSTAFQIQENLDRSPSDLKVQSPVVGVGSQAGPESIPASRSHSYPQQDIGSQDGRHRRRLSIVSMGGGIMEEAPVSNQPPRNVRPGNGHLRAASMQVLPRRSGLSSPGPGSGPGYDRAFTVPSPFLHSSPNPAQASPNSYAMARSRSQTNSISSLGGPANSRKNSTRVVRPKTQTQGGEEPDTFRNTPRAVDQIRKGHARMQSPRRSENGEIQEPMNPVSKILSPASINGTPRSSGEFYSMSNNSTETLASEYVAPDSNRSLLRPAHSRQSSVVRPPKKPAAEVLMMGFGQIMGSYVLDGSLVNQGPFEEVKRKAIVGGRGGGGVVRSESTKRDSGILGSFGWGNLGDSLGGLLGGNEMSSIKEAKKSSGTRAIPLLSTPQSILFVDLRLEPGESKSFTYSHPLPRGLPPSHRGKTLKISYNLVIGTQRSAQISHSNHVQRVEVPFKVLTSIDESGETLGHDLMSPYTILTSQATTAPVEEQQDDVIKSGNDGSTSSSPQSQPALSPDFTSYVQELLTKGAQNPNQGLRSPTQPEVKHPFASRSTKSTMKELVDNAISKSNVPTASKQSANRFEIKRGGDRVAAIMLARPAFRLGETISVAIDFQDADASCYSVHSTLETWETVDPTIALRSKASIHRVTRRIYASQHESAISAQRIFFSPTIPPTAVPDFITTGVNLEWGLRFEFVTNRLGDLDESEQPGDSELLEEVLKDERGTLKVAVQGLLCENFDVTVPIRVYGAMGPFDENTEAGEFQM